MGPCSSPLIPHTPILPQHFIILLALEDQYSVTSTLTEGKLRHKQAQDLAKDHRMKLVVELGFEPSNLTPELCV